MIGSIEGKTADDLFLFSLFEKSKESWAAARQAAYKKRGLPPLAFWFEVACVVPEHGVAFSKFTLLEPLTDEKLAWAAARAAEADEIIMDESARYGG